MFLHVVFSHVVVRTILAFGLLIAAPAVATAAPLPPDTPAVSSDLTPNPTGKIAEPADDVAHPGVTTEWWYASVMDPASKQQAVFVIFNAPVPTLHGFLMYGDKVSPLSVTPSSGLPMVTLPHSGAVLDGKPGVRTDLGEITYDEARRAYHLRINAGPLLEADVWLDRGQLPGVTGIIDLQNQGQWMGWTSPVATSTVRGFVRFAGGAPIDVTGWRGYHDHNWGNFTMVDQVADGWEWGVSHEPDGGASMIGGLLRRGGQWTGSVVDVRPSGTRLCGSSTIEFADWTAGPSLMSGATFSLPGRITATCGPAEPHQFSKTFHLVEPVVADIGLLGASFEAPYRTVEGSVGMFEHIRTLLARLDQVQPPR